MEKFAKVIITLLVLAFAGYAVYATYHAGMLNYFENASFINSALLLIGVGAAIYLAGYFLTKMWKNKLMSFVILATIAMTSCDYAKSNQQVVISEDCGSTWKKIEAGSAVPKKGMNYCYMKVVMPNYPMQGTSKFTANLLGKVKVKAEIDYDYQITNALKFIPNAKYLGAANQNADTNEALDQSAFEAAENTVIEKRIREVAKRLFALEDIVDVDPTELEQRLLDESNKVLLEFGVELNFITLTFIPDEQTNQAIDVATAMRIYESKNLGELGKKIIEARAGATKVEVTQQPAVVKDGE